jgi:membrane protease YdiL (CAAX protease family)
MRTRSSLWGIVVFFGITFVLTFASVRVLARTATDAATITIWRATLTYVLAVGWQPLVAVWIVRRTVDALPSPHLRQDASRSYMRLAILLAMLLIIGAVVVQAALGPPVEHATELPPHSSIGGFAAAVAVLWMQAIVEEVTWRGYLMHRLMAALGPWPGLCVHGILWGACYAPVFLAGASADGPHLVGYIVTMGLLGTVLGWLRLASGGLAPSAAANATLTIAAGLPLLLDGTTPLLGAVFEPAGWLPMLLFVATIVTRPALRTVVAR